MARHPVTRHGRWAVALCLVGTLVLAGRVSGQASRSEPLARDLATLMGAQKLDAIAARHPTRPDTFVAALVFPGVQLLVVSGKPTDPAAAQARLEQKQYADVYATLQQAVVPESKVFVQDLKADGLHAKAVDAVDIVYERVVQQTMFDGNPAKRRLTEAKYAEQFAAADTQYSELLSVLIAAARQQAASAAVR